MSMNDAYIKAQRAIIEMTMPMDQLPREVSESLEEWLNLTSK